MDLSVRMTDKQLLRFRDFVKEISGPHELDACAKILEAPGSDLALARQIRSCLSACAVERERLTPMEKP